MQRPPVRHGELYDQRHQEQPECRQSCRQTENEERRGIWAKLELTRLIVSLAVILTLVAAGGAAFIWSGLYNVAASRDHFSVTTWILEKVLEQSVATQSAFIETPPLDDPDMVRLGAAHYEGGCVPCHSRPGEPINVIVSQMLPSPPHLADVAAGQPPEELYWIVKNGLKYTGMPAWPAPIRDDEVWALTAFLMELAGGEMDNYRQLAGIDRVPPGALAGTEPTHRTEAVTLTQCIRCHDDAAVSTISTLVPKLGGQSIGYLERALKEYAARVRRSRPARGWPVSPADAHSSGWCLRDQLWDAPESARLPTPVTRCG